MKITEWLFGSKYNKKLPYTYHAKYQILNDCDELSKDWFGDTFCSVCNYLRKNNVQTKDVTIYECYMGKDVEMPKEAYTCIKGEWLQQDELCQAHARYGAKGSYFNCKFGDRDRTKVK